ncbi:uncharacterized protein [Primulina huaijiensis]|uniref:uncharacterized protein isoform X2 n=1 Tax=Primulina huaijiensis TaxID=1492673 RepID=UPI003CC7559B
MFRFVNRHTIPYMPYVTRLDKNGKIEHLNERASVLAERLSGASTNQLVLVPHNVGSVRLFNSNKERKGKKQAIWEVVKGPRQPDSKQCGFYVMRFMREMIEKNATSEKNSISSIFMKTEYSKEEIDEVRCEWAECIQDYIYD